jgi:hypothetical protein
MGTAMNAASQATLVAQRHLELLDECLVGFFVQLDRNAEKLFDWAGSNTFGASLDLSAVHSTAKEANELLGAAVMPILSKLSIVSAVTEVQDEQAKLQAKLQQEQEKQEREKKKREQEENEARSWVDRQVRSCAGKNPSKSQLAFVKVTLLLSIVVGIIGLIVAIVSQLAINAAPEPASIQAPIAIPEPTPLEVVVSEPASNQAPMATPEPTRSEVERIPMRPPEPASSQAPTPVPEPSPTIEDIGQGVSVPREEPEVRKALPVSNYLYAIQYYDPRFGPGSNTAVMAPDEPAARRRFLKENPGCRITEIQRAAGPRR